MRAFVLTTLLCLIVSRPAWAECAWVLWLNDGYVRSSGNTEMTPLAAYETKAKCDQQANALQERRDKDHPTSSFVYVCWPDTVDPRGPKKTE